jgi:chromosomal replication initiation ATPase DnaA
MGVGVTPYEQSIAAIAAIARRHGVSFADIMKPSHLLDVSEARQHCYWQLRKDGRSLPRIARYMGLKGHHAVFKGIQRHQAKVDQSAFDLAGYSEGLIWHPLTLA